MVSLARGVQQPKPGDVFIGYHADTTASVILQVCRTMAPDMGQDEDVDAFKQRVSIRRVS